MNYFYELNKPIYYIDTADICKGHFSILLEKSKWFIDDNYKDVALLEGSNVIAN